MRNERHRRDAGVEQLGTLLQLEGGAGLGEVRSDIAHGNGPLQRGREAAAGDLADLIAFAVKDERAFADGLTALDVEADALLRRAVLKLGEDTHSAWEAASAAAPLVDS